MKRIICLLAILALALTFTVIASAANFFSAQQSEITAAAGETITVTLRANGASVTSLGFKLTENENFEFVSGKWEFSEDVEPDISEGMTVKDGVLQPAVCAFSEAAALDGTVFKLTLKAAENASGSTELEVTASYAGEDMSNVRETITVKVTFDGTAAEVSEAEENSGAANESAEPSAPEASAPEGGEESGSGWIIFVVIGVAAVAAAVCAFVFFKKKSSK